MNKTVILPMIDGGILEVRTDYESYEGCETCNYGSRYTNEFEIKMTQGTIKVVCSQMYEFPFQKDEEENNEEDYYVENGWGYAPWSEGDLMKIILPNNDKIKEMTEEEFVEWFKSELEGYSQGAFLAHRGSKYEFVKRKEEK